MISDKAKIGQIAFEFYCFNFDVETKRGVNAINTFRCNALRQQPLLKKVVCFNCFNNFRGLFPLLFFQIRHVLKQPCYEPAYDNYKL